MDKAQNEFGRLKVFRACVRFKRHRDFEIAFSKDRGPISFLINSLTQELYRHDCCSEYGINADEGESFLREEINRLPKRYRFLADYIYEIFRQYKQNW